MQSFFVAINLENTEYTDSGDMNAKISIRTQKVYAVSDTMRCYRDLPADRLAGAADDSRNSSLPCQYIRNKSYE